MSTTPEGLKLEELIPWDVKLAWFLHRTTVTEAVRLWWEQNIEGEEE